MGITIDSAVSGILAVFTAATGKTPNFKVKGGSHRENLALQNIQARYLFKLMNQITPLNTLILLGYAWSFLTCLPNSCCGFKGEMEAYW